MSLSLTLNISYNVFLLCLLLNLNTKMFSETNFVEQDFSRNCLALVKTSRVSKYMLSAQKLCCSYYEYKKARVRNIVPSRKMNQYQILNKTKNN